MMMEHVFAVLREQNKKSVHILVRDNHKVALKCYSDLGFVPVGECELFEKYFVCMEKNYKKSPIFLLLQNTIFQIWKDR